MLIDSDVLTLSDFNVITIDEPNFDYSIYPLWVEQKKLSNEVYRKLKEIEFKIRKENYGKDKTTSNRSTK
jgi:hypothetical protein